VSSLRLSSGPSAARRQTAPHPSPPRVRPARSVDRSAVQEWEGWTGVAKKKRGPGLLGLFAFIILVLLIVAYLQSHNFHVDLPDFSSK
jgi:hypothetical protein